MKTEKVKKVKPKYVKICPNCGSLDIRSIDPREVAGGAPPIYLCASCGLRSYTFPHVDVNELKGKK